MNAPVRVEQIGYEIVRDHTYSMNADDFTSGVVVTDAASGRQMMCGTTRLGNHMTTVLNAPLCSGCDDPVGRDGVCANCEVIHADIADSCERVWL